MGYNYSLQEALFRTAQLAADTGGGAVPSLFSWPSDATVAGYIADRDAVTYARDDLAQVLQTLSKLGASRKVVLIGRSLGGWLVMETVRQLRLQRRDDVINRLEIGLAAPDIDAEVFRRQLDVIGPLDLPLVMLVSADDRALGISRRLTRDRVRIGAADVRDCRIQPVAARAKLRVIDISAVAASDQSKHDRIVYFAAALGTQAHTTRKGFGDLRQSGAFVFNAAGSAVGTPFQLVGRVMSTPAVDPLLDDQRMACPPRHQGVKRMKTAG